MTLPAVRDTHLHVSYGVEIHRGKPIIYSLGDFVFDGFDLPAAKVGGLVKITLDRSGVSDWRFIDMGLDENGAPHPLTR